MSNKKILIVDDDPAHVLLMKKCLKGIIATYEIIDAQDTLSAFDKIINVKDFDLVLLDMNLGQTSGLSLLKEIRKETGLQSLSVIMISTSELSEDFESAYREKANCYLFKASDPEIFKETLCKAVKFFLG